MMQVELVEPPEDSVPGERVSVQGYEEEPDEQLNPKKKIFEQVWAALCCQACFPLLQAGTATPVSAPAMVLTLC